MKSVLCPGDSKITRDCYKPSECAGEGKYTGEWTAWSPTGKCLALTCGGILRNHRYIRHCEATRKTNMDLGYECPGAKEKTGQCTRICTKEELAQMGGKSNYGQWGPWRPWRCDRACDNPSVNAKRERKCNDAIKDYTCQIDESGISKTETGPCRVNGVVLCVKEWGGWGPWSSCRGTCGTIYKTRVRDCLRFGTECVGKPNESEECEQKPPCPLIDGGWGGWGRWETTCSVTCGNGVMRRTRLCNNPAPSGGGRECEGDVMMTRQCEIDVTCPIHGAWTEWTPWACEVSCGGGSGKANGQFPINVQ